jgi:hypothetical protein
MEIVHTLRQVVCVKVNLRRERFLPRGLLNPKLPSLQTHPQAEAARQRRPLCVHNIGAR